MKERLPNHSGDHQDQMSALWEEYVEYCESIGYIPHEPDFAFSRSSRRAIWRRDEGQCQQCAGGCANRSLECAHYSHERDDYYNDPDNGRLLCRPQHFIEHYEQHDPYLKPHQHQWAAGKIWLRMNSEERKWLKENY